MRPTPRTQNPTSFIRKWPRHRREQRGPDEVIRVVTVTKMYSENPITTWSRLTEAAKQAAPTGRILKTWCAVPCGEPWRLQIEALYIKTPKPTHR